MVIRVDEKARISFIRPCLMIICSAIYEVWTQFGVDAPVLTGGAKSPTFSYPGEPSHWDGYAYDFRTSDLPRDRVILAFHEVTIRLRGLNSQYRAILFHDGYRFEDTAVTDDTAKHPEHLHIVLQR